MDNKDFFDEEYSKLESKKENTQQTGGDWYSRQPEQSRPSSNKALYIALICFALIICIVLGWTLCTIFTGIQSSEERLLAEVLSVLDNEYYKNVSDAAVWEGVEEAGTALLRTAGDRFSMLLSPASHYNLRNPQSAIGSDKEDVFGMSFQIVEGIGLYVSSVTTNSNCYGVLEEGDIIVKLNNINSDAGVTIGATNYNEVFLNQISADLAQQILIKTNSANFSVLRNGEVFVKYIARGRLDYVNSQYPFEFVEFYFGDDCTNVSLTHGSVGPQISTKEARLLERLSRIPKAGYIRIDQFMDAMTDTGNTTASGEFEQVLNLFVQRGLKYLILDLKGNPGGDVRYVSDIAGMLVTDSKLTASQQNALRNKERELLITTLKTRNMGNATYYAESRYDKFFGELGDKANIVVWTDGGSASASELLTGALRDYKTAVQMGTTTYGKGIAQTIKELKNYQGTFEVDGEKITYCWAVYYTVAEYFSPVTDTNIHGVGYTPDAQYNGLDTYDKLWTATESYFKSSAGGTVV